VSRWPGPYADSVVWQIGSNACQPNLTRLQYGIVPEGFNEETPAQPLSPGVIYSVWIEGCAYLNSPGGAFFNISDNRVRRVDSEERERILNAAP